VHFTPEPSCIAASLDLSPLDHISAIQWKRHLIEAVHYDSWTGDAIFSIRRLEQTMKRRVFSTC